MKCPNCGNEIQDGKLLCEKCGTEIHIVPDFDPEIENQIEEGLSNVADIIGEVEEEDFEADPDEFNVFSTREIRKNNLLKELYVLNCSNLAKSWNKAIMPAK